MDVDVSKVLAFEIKKELADRYFGHRKIIEEDKEELRRKIGHFTRSSVQKICFDLVRIYILLRDEKLIREFTTTVGLEDEFFYDPYFSESLTIRARVFEGVEMRGLTQAGRFKNLLFDCYDELVRHVAKYREIFGELLEDLEIINAQIDLFYEKNDISNIMGFFRSLDSQNTQSVATSTGGMEFSERLESKMKVEPPLPLDQSMPVISPLVPLSHVRKKLKKIAERALGFHPGGFVINPLQK